MKRSLAAAFVVSLVFVGCRERSHEPPPTGETTTTGVELPGSPATPNLPPTNAEPITPPGNEPTPDVRTDEPPRATMTAPATESRRREPPPRSVAPGAANDTAGASTPPGGTTPRSALPAEPGNSSFEQSGGSSGLGIYGQDVPGSERWRVGPSAPAAGRDGGVPMTTPR